MSHYVQINLWTQPSGRVVWLRCLTATADYYGWLDAYPSSEELPDPTPPPREFRYLATTRFRPDVGGRPRRICRSNSRHGNPRGATNRFRISTQVSNRHLAELAQVTKVPFKWMETVGGQRVSYDRWLEYGISGKLFA